jgi:23S rRNA (adenine2503-C2)-methyltransferase
MKTKADRNLLGFGRSDLEQFAVELGQPHFTGRLIYRTMYARRVHDFALMTDLSRRFRSELAARWRIAYPQILGRMTSSDGSVRYLLGLDDGEKIETVYMPEENRTTLCLSSQAGCAVDCRFCFTALLGLRRNLTAGEIVGQALAVAADQRIPKRGRLNLVLMGMGEPLLNLGPVMKAVRILADPEGGGIPLRRITVSTSGIVPRIYDFAREPMRPKLAISLNASTEEQRSALMPVNRKYSLSQLMKACSEFPLRPREKLTFEYVMLGGVNDADSDAVRVAGLLGGIRSKVNLIPYNPGPGLPYRASPMSRVLAFQSVLAARRIPAFIRVSRGRDVMAACGQLRLAGATEAGAVPAEAPESATHRSIFRLNPDHRRHSPGGASFLSIGKK